MTVFCTFFEGIIGNPFRRAFSFFSDLSDGLRRQIGHCVIQIRNHFYAQTFGVERQFREKPTLF